MDKPLSRIYFDDVPLRLPPGDTRPPLERVVRAGGQVPGQVDVLLIDSPFGRDGPVLHAGELIDRTVDPTKPIYLRSVPRDASAAVGGLAAAESAVVDDAVADALDAVRDASAETPGHQAGD